MIYLKLLFKIHSQTVLRWHTPLAPRVALFRAPLFLRFPFPHRPWFFLLSHVAHRTSRQSEHATNLPQTQKRLITLSSPPYFTLLYSSDSFTWFFALFLRKKKCKLFPFIPVVHYAPFQGCLESYSMSALTSPPGASQSCHALDPLLPQY